MTKDEFELPDMGDLARQMEEALASAQEAMEDLPVQMGDLGSVMGSLSALMGGVPGQLAELSPAIEMFEAQHETNAASLSGEPDWFVEAEIRVGEKLHILVSAEFDLDKVRDAWRSTQSMGFESLVAGVVAQTGEEVDATLLGQITGQLKQGRSSAAVAGVDVLACRIQGAPGNAAENLRLAPEAGIPLVMNERGLGFEFAPLLTIRNRWERAEIPTFVPMSEEIVIPLAHFDDGEAFQFGFELTGQDEGMTVSLSFRSLG